jgi:hypothetical protein
VYLQAAWGVVENKLLKVGSEIIEIVHAMVDQTKVARRLVKCQELQYWKNTYVTGFTLPLSLDRYRSVSPKDMAHIHIFTEYGLDACPQITYPISTKKLKRMKEKTNI